MPKKTSNFDNIDAAIKAIQDDGISQKSAAKKFGVARSTLQFRLKNPDKQNISCGPSTVLTTNEEEILVKWLLESSKKGFPRRREVLQDSVKKFLDEQERPSPFKNNLPGIGWYKAFLRRHPILSIRTSEHVTNASANVCNDCTEVCFGTEEHICKSKNLPKRKTNPEISVDNDTSNNLTPTTHTAAYKKQKLFNQIEVKNVFEDIDEDTNEEIEESYTDGLSTSHCGLQESDDNIKSKKKLKDKKVSSLLSSLIHQRQEMIDLFKAKEEQEKKREQLLELRLKKIEEAEQKTAEIMQKSNEIEEKKIDLMRDYIATLSKNK